MAQAPGEELAVGERSRQLVGGHGKMVWCVGEGDHAGGGPVERTIKARAGALVKLNPDGGTGAGLMAGKQPLAKPLKDTGKGSVELVGGQFGREKAVGEWGAGDEVVLVAEIAHAVGGPVGDRLAGAIGGIILDMPGTDHALGVEDGGDLGIAVLLSEGTDPVKQG